MSFHFHLLFPYTYNLLLLLTGPEYTKRVCVGQGKSLKIKTDTDALKMTSLKVKFKTPEFIEDETSDSGSEDESTNYQPVRLYFCININNDVYLEIKSNKYVPTAIHTS